VIVGNRPFASADWIVDGRTWQESAYSLEKVGLRAAD
jgi:hypothetical protein